MESAPQNPSSAQHADYERPWRAEDCCPLDHCNCPPGFHDQPFPCWCGFFNADYVCEEHMPQTKAELLLKIQELESIIWDGTRQLAALESALKQASECCARPAGVCFPVQDHSDD